MLNVKCISATLFEFEFAPIDASNAVTHVPIFAPSTINRARSKGKTLLPTIVITTPVAADELCINAVNIMPTTIRSNGKSITPNIFLNKSLTSGLPNACSLLITFSPTKIRPKPQKRLPAILTFSRFVKPINTPTNASKYINILK